MKPVSHPSQTDRRQHILGVRRHLDPATIEEKSTAIAKRVAQSDAFKAANTIGLYLPIKGEVDTRLLIRLAIEQGKCVALPRVDGRDMRFYVYDEGQHKRGTFGIDEPVGDRIIATDTIDLLCLPLVAFDVRGNRIGMGGGYYDKALEAVKDQQKPWRIGLAYELQKLERIHTNPWDIPLHAVATELKLYTVT
ncbi:MAG: 5-formyltetrahydrofolate cyclo-ligase [Pseudomonadota bacterium]